MDTERLNIWVVQVFTFQSGSIQIYTGNQLSLSLLRFTFQSGSIQICCVLGGALVCNLYIPIWFYSNIIPTLLNRTYLNLYIPIWFYSNKSEATEQALLIDLYIPIWFYSNSSVNLPFIPSANFTFQSGSIQILTLNLLLLLISALHSNLVLFKWQVWTAPNRSRVTLHSNLVLFK